MNSRRNKPRFHLRPNQQIRLMRNLGASLLLAVLVWGTYKFYQPKANTQHALVVRVQKVPISEKKYTQDSTLARISSRVKQLKRAKGLNPLEQAQLQRLEQETRLRKALEDHMFRQRIQQEGSRFPMAEFRKKEQILKRQLQNLPSVQASSSPR